MSNEIPEDVENRLEAHMAAFQAHCIDADVRFIGKLEDYESQAMREGR